MDAIRYIIHIYYGMKIQEISFSNMFIFNPPLHIFNHTLMNLLFFIIIDPH